MLTPVRAGDFELCTSAAPFAHLLLAFKFTFACLFPMASSSTSKNEYEIHSWTSPTKNVPKSKSTATRV